MLSPQNPMKPTLAAPYEHRKRMLELTLEEVQLEGVSLSTIESELPAPSYTVNTIEELKRRYPDMDFVILCGTDVKEQCAKWHRADELLKMVEFVEYPRYLNDDLPFVDISSTELRQGEKLECLAVGAREYIKENSVYDFNLERGRVLYKRGEIAEAINEWNRSEGTEAQRNEARTLIELANQILAYRYSEIYNP